MLNVFRDNLKHLKWVLWFVIVGLVLYLGYYFGGTPQPADGTAAWAARVDGSAIPVARFATAVGNLDDYYRRLMGDRYDELRPQLSLGRQVVNRLVDEQIQIHEARKLGLATSPEEIARYIQNDPNMRDPSTGQFVGKEIYTRAMSTRWPGGVADYEKSVGDMLTIQKWLALATEVVDVTDTEIEDAYRARAERTRLDYAIVPAAAQTVDTKVSDAEVRGWYDTRPNDYQRGEARRIRYLTVDRQAQVAKVPVSDDDIRAFYSANAAQFASPEQRRASHILFRVAPSATPADKERIRAEAEAALQQARSGADFAELARTLSQDTTTRPQGGDLGFFGRGTMSPTFEQAAFSTPVGELAPLTETPFGFHVIRVTETQAEGTQPIAEVTDTIRRQLEQQKAQELVQSEAQRIRAQITAASDLDAVAAKETLTVEERVLARDERPGDLGPSPQFISAVFAAEPGGISEPLGVARGMAVFTVVENLPPARRPFEEVKDRVRSDLLNARKSAAARSAASAALAKHKSVGAAAAAMGWDLKRDVEATPRLPLSGTGGASPEMERALFGPSVAKGDTGTAPVPSGAILYEITDVERFDPATLRARRDGLRDELLSQKRGAFLQAAMNSLREKYKDRIEINEAVVDQATR